MFSSSHEDGQLTCWNCEELVHRSALYCPYCNADLRKHVPLHTDSPKAQTVVSDYAKHCLKSSQLKNSKNSSHSAIWFIATLFFMLAGTTFLLLSVIIGTFSKAGSFIISWPERNWLPYLGLGIALVSFGLFLMQQKGDSEIS